MERIDDMRIYLTKEQCSCGIPQLYENISYVLNGKSMPQYDCTKVNVTEKVFDEIREYYRGLGQDDVGINMAWVFAGPKASIEEDSYAIEVEDGWCGGKKEDDWESD